MRNGLAAVTAQIAAANRPKITADKQSLDLGSAVENYFKAQNLRDQRQRSDLLSSAGNALAKGGEQGFMADLAKADPVAAYNLQQDGKYKDLAYALKEKALDNKNPEMTNQSKNFEYLVAAGYPRERAAAMAFGGSTESVWDKISKEQALAAEKTENLYNRNVPEIDELVSSIQQNPDTMGWKSPIKTIAARVTGTSPEYLLNRGENIRRLGTVQNNLIAEAKAAGQSGINTMAEIRQATKGLNENSSPEEVVGALNAMKDSISRMRSQVAAQKAGNQDYKTKYGLE